jgi:hypothetical protein
MVIDAQATVKILIKAVAAIKGKRSVTLKDESDFLILDDTNLEFLR